MVHVPRHSASRWIYIVVTDANEILAQSDGTTLSPHTPEGEDFGTACVLSASEKFQRDDLGWAALPQYERDVGG